MKNSNFGRIDSCSGYIFGQNQTTNGNKTTQQVSLSREHFSFLSELWRPRVTPLSLSLSLTHTYILSLTLYLSHTYSLSQTHTHTHIFYLSLVTQTLQVFSSSHPPSHLISNSSSKKPFFLFLNKIILHPSFIRQLFFLTSEFPLQISVFFVSNNIVL